MLSAIELDREVMFPIRGLGTAVKFEEVPGLKSDCSCLSLGSLVRDVACCIFLDHQMLK